jgi:hypothetical protein
MFEFLKFKVPVYKGHWLKAIWQCSLYI